MSKLRSGRASWRPWVLLFAVAVIAAACAPGTNKSSSNQPSSTAASANASWDQVVAAAEKEGKVVVAGPQGGSYLPALTQAFQAKYPKIKVEMTQSGGSDMVARVLPERDAGRYLEDVGVGSPGDGFQSLQPKGALDPLTNYLLPETIADAQWRGGWDAGWMDKDKKYVYAFVATVDDTIFVNRSLVPESQFNKAEDLLNPKWKGKIAMIDPRLGRAGTQRLALVLAEKGEDFSHKLVVDQKPVMTGDNRQVAEWIVRGTYPIAFAVPNDQLATLKAQGAPTDQVKALSGSDPIFKQYGHGGGGSVWAFNRAPHPNAAKVYINFLLSQEGQTSFSKNTLVYNSRRVDVTPVNQATLPDPNAKYTDVQKQGTDQYPLQVVELTRQWLGNP